MSDEELTPERNIRRFLGFAAGGFVITCVVFFFLASWIAPSVEPGFPVTDAARPDSDGTFELTIDVKSRNDWVGVDLRQGKVVSDPDAADVLARRYLMRAPGGASDLGAVALSDAKVDPKTEWVRDELVDGAPQNAALSAWYTYSYMTHLLTSRGHTFAVELTGGAGVALINVVSYYCEPEGSGCMTLRYRLDGGG